MRHRDPPAIAVDGLVEHVATDSKARSGEWPWWFARMIATHYRGSVPNRLEQKVNARRIELARRKDEGFPWESGK